MFIINPDYLIDGSGEDVRAGIGVLVDAERIAATGPLEALVRAAPEGTPVLHGKGSTLLPGFVDAHVHLMWGLESQPGWAAARGTEAGRVIWALIGAQTSLAAGVTTQRDCGSPDFAILSLKQSITEGPLAGPRIIASGPCITTTGGHAEFIGLTADSITAVRQRVRQLSRAGVDFIKVMASGGDMDPHTNRRASQFTDAQFTALVEDAHRLRLPVVAHCNATTAIRQAIEAHVETIAHCNWLGPSEGTIAYDHRVADMILASGTVIDLNIEATIAPFSTGDGAAQAWTDSFQPKNRWELHSQLREGGAHIVLSSDAFGAEAAKFPYLLARAHAAVGATLTELVHRSTELAAKAVGLNDVGRICPGMIADLALFHGDIGASPELLGNAPAYVWVAGTCVARDGHVLEARLPRASTGTSSVPEAGQGDHNERCS